MTFGLFPPVPSWRNANGLRFLDHLFKFRFTVVGLLCVYAGVVTLAKSIEVVKASNNKMFEGPVGKNGQVISLKQAFCLDAFPAPWNPISANFF